MLLQVRRVAYVTGRLQNMKRSNPLPSPFNFSSTSIPFPAAATGGRLGRMPHAHNSDIAVDNSDGALRTFRPSDTMLPNEVSAPFCSTGHRLNSRTHEHLSPDGVLEAKWVVDCGSIWRKLQAYGQPKYVPVCSFLGINAGNREPAIVCQNAVYTPQLFDPHLGDGNSLTLWACRHSNLTPLT